MLPYLDQVALYNSVDQTEDGMGAANQPPTSAKNAAALATRVSVFECPSDSVFAGGTSYRACIGTGPSATQSVPQDAPGAAKLGAICVGGMLPVEFRDGLSNTIFFSEKLVGSRDQNHFTPWRDYFIAGGVMTYPADAEQACRLPASITNPIHGAFGGSAWLFSGLEHTWYDHVFTPNSASPDCSSGPMSPGSGGVGAFTARSNHVRRRECRARRRGGPIHRGRNQYRHLAGAIDIQRPRGH